METKQKQDVILVVDDNPQNIKYLSGILAGDYTIKAAPNGEKGLEIALTTPQPDLILLDIMMSGLDGYEVCRRLKANEHTSHIPVIFATALGESSEEAKGLKLGAVDYIAKPFSSAIIKSRVKTQLDLKQAREHLEELVEARTRELVKAYDDLKSSQEHVLQQEKLATIGQLAAGVAHEINNPTGYIASNLSTLNKYLGRIQEFLDAQSEVIQAGNLDQGWEWEVKNEIEAGESPFTKETSLACLIDWATEYLEFAEEKFTQATWAEKRAMFKRFFNSVNPELKPIDVTPGLAPDGTSVQKSRGSEVRFSCHTPFDSQHPGQLKCANGGYSGNTASQKPGDHGKVYPSNWFIKTSPGSVARLRQKKKPGLLTGLPTKKGLSTYALSP